MKIPIQEKIAELERRIEALEKPRRTATTQTTTTTSQTVNAPLTATQQASLDRMWKHFDGVFDAMRGIFR